MVVNLFCFPFSPLRFNLNANKELFILYNFEISGFLRRIIDISIFWAV